MHTRGPVFLKFCLYLNEALSVSQAKMTDKREHAIHVLFLEPAPDDHWLNRLTSSLGERIHGKGFCHVEICIPAGRSGGTEGYVSSSIYNGESVTMTQKKTFANPGYTVHTEMVSTRQLQCISDGISEANRRQMSFDPVGMVLSMLPFPLGMTNDSKTFCSRYITELLQMGNVGGEGIQSLDARTTTPSKLHRILKNSVDVGVVGTVSHKQNDLRKNGYIPLQQYPQSTSIFSVE